MQFFNSKTPATVLIAASSLVTSSCCKDKQCSSVNEIHHIDMVGFDKSELDTITYETFTAGTGFLDPIETTEVISDSIGGGYNSYIELPSKFDPSLDLRVTTSGSNLKYQFSDFETKKIPCNKCSDYHGEDYRRIKSYYLDGVIKKMSELRIDKK